MGKIFGVPLNSVLDYDRKKYPGTLIPLILKQTIRYIQRSALDTEGLFRINGNKEKVATYKKMWDEGENLDYMKEKEKPSVHDVCSLMKLFLRELPTPILIPDQTFTFDKWIKIADLADKTKQIETLFQEIKRFPSNHFAFLSHLFPTLARVAKNSHLTKMDAANIAISFANSILWGSHSSKDSAENLVNSEKVNRLIQLLIENWITVIGPPADEQSKYGSLEWKLLGHESSVIAALDHNSKSVWTFDSHGMVKVWDIETCIERFTFSAFGKATSSNRLFCAGKDPNGNIMTGSQSSVKFWDPATPGKLIKEYNIVSTAISVVKETVWVGSESCIQVFDRDLNQGKRIGLTPAHTIVDSLFYDEKRDKVWASTHDKKYVVHVFDATTAELKKSSMDAHKRKINCFALSCMDHMWSGGEDAICVWDPVKYVVVKRIEKHSGQTHGILAVGEYMWTCGWDTIVRVWHSRTFDLVCEFADCHTDIIVTMSLIWDARRQVVQVWSVSGDKSVCTFVVNKDSYANMTGAFEKLKLTKSMSDLDQYYARFQNGPLNEKSLQELNKRWDDLQKKKDEWRKHRDELLGRRNEIDHERQEILKKKKEIDEKKKMWAERKLQLEIELGVRG